MQILFAAVALGWLLNAFLVAWVAGEKRRSPGAWFFLALLFSPLFAMLAVIGAPPVPAKPGMRWSDSPPTGSMEP